MTVPAPRFWHYESLGVAQPIMSFGPDSGPQLLIVPPLFEELNRTRKLISDTMRALSAKGISSHLPDLPGTGESETDLVEAEWPAWRQAVTDAASSCKPSAKLAIRGGCLLDDAAVAVPLMRFSPFEGKRLIRDLVRSRSLNDPDFDSDAQKAVFTNGPSMLGGYAITSTLARAVRDADIADVDNAKILRLDTEHGEADAKLPGPPLWRRAEPSGSPELTEALVDAIAEWMV
ncbi:hypothetical protein [Parasphingopyxis lamellibrachiae]|uniref:Uncharacterized protein n=1 Tax=Parasphingopyxis lamellibrachiae TaxID=680125 RepID=A0A3D9FF16_9SPHN|nr:hypothetical protein [Parasphingopyxis lamellibrachiae]RED15676.1 hypothetical protein DFR46_0675 [Parasphingopyxis lamellibrachiae]